MLGADGGGGKSLASTWNRCLPGRWRTVSLQQPGENPTLTVCSGLVHAPTPCRTLPPRPPIGSQPFKTLAVVLIYFRSGPGWRPGVNSLPPDISLRSIFVSLPAKTGAEGRRQLLAFPFFMCSLLGSVLIAAAETWSIGARSDPGPTAALVFVLCL